MKKKWKTSEIMMCYITLKIISGLKQEIKIKDELLQKAQVKICVGMHKTSYANLKDFS